MKHLTKKEQVIALSDVRKLKTTIQWQKEEIKKHTDTLKMLKGGLKQNNYLLNTAMFIVKHGVDKEVG
jgi:hypothetical protein